VLEPPQGCHELYRWAVREAGRRGWKKICSYTLESEPGTSLLAAGFQAGRLHPRWYQTASPPPSGQVGKVSQARPAKRPAQPEMKRMNMHIEAGLHDAFQAATAAMGCA
jgi:hypothetical protein